MQDALLRHHLAPDAASCTRAPPSQGHKLQAKGATMFRLINLTTIIFFGVFLIGCAGLAVWDLFFVWPRQQCEADGARWDDKDNQCLTPMPLWQITGRRLNAPKGGASTVTSL